MHCLKRKVKGALNYWHQGSTHILKLPIKVVLNVLKGDVKLLEWELAFYHDPEMRFMMYTQELTLLLTQQGEDNPTTYAWNRTPLPQAYSTVYSKWELVVSSSSTWTPWEAQQ